MASVPTPLEQEDVFQILVVDDEVVIRQILADFLSMEGFTVDTAEDGEAALKKLEAATYDIVISDMKMPRMNGIELIESVQKRGMDVLVVMMTAYGTVETAIDAMKKGAYDYLLKPFKMEEVIRVVQRGLENRRLARENMLLRETIALYRACEQIASSTSLDAVLRQVVDTALREANADHVLLHLDGGGGSYELRTEISRVKRPFGAGWLDLVELFHAHEQGQPVLAHGERTAVYLVPDVQAVVSLLSVPLRVQHDLVGFVTAVSTTQGGRFSEGQRKLLSVLAGRAAAAIVNARLYEELERTFRQTVQSLVRALEAMDPYTAGHSDRVAKYARLMAEQLGLSGADVDLLMQAALMHDIGKIGCHANLNKPGTLSSEEYEVFRAHPRFGKEIIEPITFLQAILPGVHLHHERWDGKGYPMGLVGEDIPLQARILAVADTYDAMTSSRAYRTAMHHAVAMQEMRRCAGSQFDPAVVAAFEAVIEGYRKRCTTEGIAVPD